VEPSFLPSVIDRMYRVPDAATIACMRWTSEVTGRSVGGSTGTNVWGAMQIIKEMRERGETGSVVTLICDGGERYTHTYLSDDWVAGQGLDPAPHLAELRAMLGRSASTSAPGTPKIDARPLGAPPHG